MALSAPFALTAFTNMSRVVVDIETCGVPFESLDAASQEYFTHYAKSEEEATAQKDLTGLWPVTAEIITIGMLNPDTGRGQVLFQDNDTHIPPWEEGNIIFSTGSEREILQKFWEEVQKFHAIITFNGRGFDAPFLILRSMVRGVRITKNLMPPRFQSDSHCDLLEQLTFFGATRKFNLDVYCKAFGIPTPKDGGIEGKEVGAAHAAGRYVDIAKYNARDLHATAALFKKWEAALNG